MPDQTKAEIRAHALAARDAVPADTRSAWSAAIVERLLGSPLFQEAGSIAVYISFRSEVETAKLLAAALAEGKRVAAPVTVWAERRLELRWIQSPADLVAGRWGIGEPGPTCPPAAPRELGLIAVPGAAFDRRGYRVGYGAGLYDRLLADAPGVVTAGLAFSIQVVPAVPAGPHDRPVDWLVTETECIPCQRLRGKDG